jgi:hypothetical protein
MTPVQIQMIAALLRVVSTAVANNSGDKATVRRIADYIGLGTTLIESGSDAANKIKDLTAKVQEFVDQGRSPTDEEFDQLKIRSDSSHDRIQKAASRNREGAPLEKPASGTDPSVTNNAAEPTDEPLNPATESRTRRET